MDSNYVNDVDNLYRVIQKIEKILLVVFLLIFILSIINSFFDYDIVLYLLLISNIFYVCISSFTDLLLKNNAERERRKTMISNAFNVDITVYKTNKYYNNRFKPSVKKMGVNCFESTLYTKENLSNMFIEQSIKILFLIIMWIIIIFKIKEKSILLLIVQSFFSAEVLFNYIRLIYYYFQVEKIYWNFYNLFVTNRYNDKRDLPLLLEYVMDYETIKNYCHIMLSDNKFKKIKDDVKVKWNQIEKNIK